MRLFGTMTAGAGAQGDSRSQRPDTADEPMKFALVIPQPRPPIPPPSKMATKKGEPRKVWNEELLNVGVAPPPTAADFFGKDGSLPPTRGISRPTGGAAIFPSLPSTRGPSRPAPPPTAADISRKDGSLPSAQGASRPSAADFFGKTGSLPPTRDPSRPRTTKFHPALDASPPRKGAWD